MRYARRNWSPNNFANKKKRITSFRCIPLHYFTKWGKLTVATNALHTRTLSQPAILMEKYPALLLTCTPCLYFPPLENSFVILRADFSQFSFSELRRTSARARTRCIGPRNRVNKNVYSLLLTFQKGQSVTSRTRLEKDSEREWQSKEKWVKGRKRDRQIENRDAAASRGYNSRVSIEEQKKKQAQML